MAAEIQAEITDHLATAAERHQSGGLGETESREKAREAFGDVAQIGRRCYWIKQGDSLMYRGAIGCFSPVLALSLIAVTLRSWQAESRMADQIGALTAQLKELAERQPAAPAPMPLPAPIEIKGRIFAAPTVRPLAAAVRHRCLGRKDSAAIEVRFEGFVYIRATRGWRFRRSGATMADERLQVQFAPIAAYPGVNVPHQDLDLAFHYGRLGITLSRPLPEFEVATGGKGKYESRIFIKVQTPRIRPSPGRSICAMPPEWPIYINRGSNLLTSDPIAFRA